MFNFITNINEKQEIPKEILNKLNFHTSTFIPKSTQNNEKIIKMLSYYVVKEEKKDDEDLIKEINDIKIN
jgi:tetrahydrodipicolinate N-succinyltransferase